MLYLLTTSKISRFLVMWIFVTPLPIINIGLNEYYFYLPSIGFILFVLAVIGVFLIKIFKRMAAKIIFCLIFLLFLSLSVSSIRTEFRQCYLDNKDTNEFVELIHTKYPTLPNNSIIYIVIPSLIGRDPQARNYFDISMEHLLQLRYGDRTLRCFPLPIQEKHHKFSDPNRIIFSDKTLFLERVGNDIVEKQDIKQIILGTKKPVIMPEKLIPE